MPVQPIVGLEGDQRLAALSIVEQADEAVGRIGDALGGVDRLCTGAAERQERGGGQDEPSPRRPMVVLVTVPSVMIVVVRMPAVVRHGVLLSSRCAGTSASSHRDGSTSR